jgi:hypothetical protein
MRRRSVSPGDFSEVSQLPIGPGEPREALRSAAQAARDAGFDWLFVLSAAETLVPDIFVKIAPALRLHDAVWGGAGLASTGKLEHITRLSAQDLPTFFMPRSPGGSARRILSIREPRSPRCRRTTRPAGMRIISCTSGAVVRPTRRHNA